MSVLTFATSIPLLSSSHLLKRCPARRCRRHCFRPRPHPRANLIDAAHREAEVEALEQRLRSLDAPEAADLAYVAFTSTPPPPSWRPLLDTLSNLNITGRTLARIISRLGIQPLLTLTPSVVPSVVEYLCTTLSLTEPQRNRILAHRPDLLRTPVSCLSSSADALLAYLNTRDLKHVTLRWPGILLLSSCYITRVTNFLLSRPALLSKDDIRNLLRRAPWVLVYDIDRDMAPAILWLCDELLPHTPAPLSKYLLASPQLLGTPRMRLHQVMRFLRDEIAMDTATSVGVASQFPPVLTCSVDTVLRPAAEFLIHDVALEKNQLGKVVRAFPTVLTLDVEEDMRVVVDYLRGQGVSNVARMVSRLPPLLGYNLETNIIPKTNYIENELGLSLYVILGFPAYFSYDLKKRIEPRTRFLQSVGVSVAHFGLNVALSLTDEEFCRRIRAPIEQYRKFQKALYSRTIREASQSDQPKLEKTDAQNQEAIFEDAVDASTEMDDNRYDARDSWNYINVSTSKRRKKRFRATLTRIPWGQVEDG